MEAFRQGGIQLIEHRVDGLGDGYGIRSRCLLDGHDDGALSAIGTCSALGSWPEFHISDLSDGYGKSGAIFDHRPGNVIHRADAAALSNRHFQ